MLRSRLLWKLYAGYVVLIALTAGIVGIVVSQRMERDSLDETARVLRAKAILLRNIASMSIDSPTTPSLEEEVRALGAEIRTRLTVIRAAGKVLADSEDEPSRMENHADRPEILSAREKGLGTDTRHSHTLGVDMMYVALPVTKDGRIAGFVRAALPLTQIDERLRDLRAVVGLGATVAMALGLIFGFFFARRVTRPLMAITEAAESIAGGKYDKELRTDATGEVGKLAETFNRMGAHLRDRMDTITKERNQVLAILAGMVEGVVAVDRQERVVHMNEVAGDIFHVSPGGSLGKPIREVTQLPAVIEMLEASLGDKAAPAREVRLPGGPKDLVIEVRASPLRDARGDPAGAVLVLHDITELRHLERVRRDFVANVSHELKTPLTAIRGLVETLLEHQDMEGEIHRRFLAKVRDQTARLTNLVTDLLTLSRVESEEGALERGPLDLREPVRESARALAPAGEAKGLTVDTQLPQGPVSVLGDREGLRQVVDNLLDNAIKYTPSGGRVWLRLRSDNGNAVIEVEDTGCGIPPDHLDRIFERFYRVDKARSRELGGTGLGLSIVKHIAIALGGQASVESTLAKGSTFRVRLPLAPSA